MRGNFNNKGSIANKAILMETKEVIAEVVFEAQLVTSVKGWVVDSTHTRHIGTFKEEFTS